MFDEFASEITSFALGVGFTKLAQFARDARARHASSWPVAIHVEDDLEIIFANTPPWVSASTFIPGVDSLTAFRPPTADPLGIAMWARNELGGKPSNQSVLEMTVRSTSPVEVVFDRVSVKAEKFDPGPGVNLFQPVGGASLEYRRFEIGLWDFACSVRAIQPGGQEIVEHAATVSPGDPLRLQLHANFQNPDDDALAYRWEVNLHFLIAGRRKSIRLPRKKNHYFELVNPQYYRRYSFSSDHGFTEWAI